MNASAAPQRILVLGPARSGKSEWAEAIAMQSQKSVLYVATAQEQPEDVEWQQRIALHQQRRPPDWKMEAVPVELSGLYQRATEDQCVLVDSLGTWVANLLELADENWETVCAETLEALEQCAADVICVAEEVGWGVVPAYPSGRLFRDRLGQLVRRVGAIAHPVYLVTGGYVLNLSQLGTPLPRDPFSPSNPT